MFNQFKILTASLLLCAGATASASSLFDGTNSDLWLIDEITGAVTGYNYNRWLEDFDQNGDPLMALGGAEQAIINNVSNSSQPMTASQPLISMAGLEEGNSDRSQAVQSALLVEPATGSYSETINVQIMVESILVQNGGATLSWQIGVAPVQTLALEPALLTDAILKNGYYV
ncbi:MAG: hypothetical protein KAT90_08245, partial [Gammaproteobacteria bacterium]|nr:hypothetical protein [Gammaproteobacteria bacterium]